MRPRDKTVWWFILRFTCSFIMTVQSIDLPVPYKKEFRNRPFPEHPFLRTTLVGCF